MINCDNAVDVIDTIGNGERSLSDIKNNQIQLKSNLSEVKKAHKRRAKEEKYTMYNIESSYKARNEALKFYEGYSSIISERKLKATKWTRLKILNPKQML